jgi:hypothetical protein
VLALSLRERGFLPFEADYQDFVEYWGAGHLNAAGENPYDADTLFEIERLASPALTEAIMMWNPPWTLTVAMPFSLLSPHLGHVLWLLGQAALMLFCADRIWLFYGAPASRRWLAWALCLGFTPVFFELRLSQISPLVLLGIVGFLHFERRGWDGLAGASLILASIKPQLVYLVGAAVFVWALERRRWRVLFGAAAALALLLVPPLACNPSVLWQYADTAAHRPPQMLSPTLGSVLRVLFGVEHFALQFLPTALGLVWLSWYWAHRRRTWVWANEMPILLLASFLTTSYGAWPFDHVVLLVPVLQAAAWAVESRRGPVIFFAAATYVAFDGMSLLLMNVSYTDYYLFAWMTPLLLFAYLAVRKQVLSEPVRSGHLLEA